MIHYTCDICDKANVTDVNEVVLSIKVRGDWFSDKFIKQVCSDCLRITYYMDLHSIAASKNFFKTLWKKTFHKSEK